MAFGGWRFASAGLFDRFDSLLSIATEAHECQRWVMNSTGEECMHITALNWPEGVIPSNEAEGIANLLDPPLLVVSAIDQIGVCLYLVINLFDPSCLLISAKSGIGPCIASSELGPLLEAPPANVIEFSYHFSSIIVLFII